MGRPRVGEKKDYQQGQQMRADSITFQEVYNTLWGDAIPMVLHLDELGERADLLTHQGLNNEDATQIAPLGMVLEAGDKMINEGRNGL